MSGSIVSDEVKEIDLKCKLNYWKRINDSARKDGKVDESLLTLDDKQKYKKFTHIINSICRWWVKDEPPSPNLYIQSEYIVGCLLSNQDALIPFWYVPEVVKYHPQIINRLFTSNHQYFLVWWDECIIDWQKHSNILCRYQQQNFDLWWDPNKYHYPSSFYFLPQKEYEFEKWWSSDIIKDCLEKCMVNIEDTDESNLSHFIRALVSSYTNEFNIWWPIVKNYLRQRFYKEFTGQLAVHLPDKFDLWWNKELIPGYILTHWAQIAKHCNDNFDKWYDPAIYTTDQWWELYPTWLMIYCNNNFPKWFGPHVYKYSKKPTIKNPFSIKHELIRHCSNHFELWWSPRKFRSLYDDGFFRLLERYCLQFQHIWGPEFVIYKLKKEQGL